jgi:hypothetical protein
MSCAHYGRSRVTARDSLGVRIEEECRVPRCCWIIALTAILASASAGASALADDLNRRFRGGWAVLEVEVFSNCSGSYNDNTVGELGISSNAGRRFAAGEIARIDRVKVKRRRVDVLLTLAHPVRVSQMDGPFELFEDRECKVQLMIPFTRDVIKTGDIGAISDRMASSMALFPSLEEAQASDSWSRRRPQPLPDDYQQTLQQHAVWKAEQINAEVGRAAAWALSQAAVIAQRLPDDDDYLAGFGAGAEEMKDLTLTDCTTLITAAPSGYRRSPPSGRSDRWREGWGDGQDLIFNLLVAERLNACSVPVPEVSSP